MEYTVNTFPCFLYKQHIIFPKTHLHSVYWDRLRSRTVLSQPWKCILLWSKPQKFFRRILSPHTPAPAAGAEPLFVDDDDDVDLDVDLDIDVDIDIDIDMVMSGFCWVIAGFFWVISGFFWVMFGFFWVIAGFIDIAAIVQILPDESPNRIVLSF